MRTYTIPTTQIRAGTEDDSTSPKRAPDKNRREYQRENSRRHRARLTDEQKAANRARDRTYKLGRTEAQKEAARAYDRKRNAAKRQTTPWPKAPRTDEQQAAANRARDHKYYLTLTDAEKSTRHAIRRARVYGNGGKHTAAEWSAMCAWFGPACLCCKKVRKLTADHVIPLASGGTNDIDNLQPLCKSCNSRKHLQETDYRDPIQLADFLVSIRK
jgi:5-methylcytosine-specific restriction endonuclease McrA